MPFYTIFFSSISLFITPSYSDEAGPRVFSSFDSVIYVAHKILGYQTYEHQYFCSFRRSSSYSTFWHDWERRAATERRSEGAYLFSALYIGMWINHARAPPGRGPHPPEFGIMGLFQTHQSPLSCKSSASTLRKTPRIKTRFDQKRFCLKKASEFDFSTRDAAKRGRSFRNRDLRNKLLLVIFFIEFRIFFAVMWSSETVK